MCRLLGVVPKGASSVDPHLLELFRGLALKGMVKPGSAPGHCDGWGIVAWGIFSPYYLGREPVDASSDPKYEEAISKIRNGSLTSPMIAHLRKASIGTKRVENTHPFVRENWAFAHNGTIRKLNLKDSTDSEWFFNCVIDELKSCNRDPITAIARQVEAVREVYRYSSMNFLLSDGLTLYAYRDCLDNPEYYTMFYTKTKDAFVVCQEKIFEGQWKELENGQLLSIDRRLHYEVTDVHALLSQNVSA